MTLSAVDAVILARLYERPSWIRSLHHVRPRVQKLCDAGLIERCKPPVGTAKNMVRITAQGVDAIEAHWRAA